MAGMTNDLANNRTKNVTPNSMDEDGLAFQAANSSAQANCWAGARSADSLVRRKFAENFRDRRTRLSALLLGCRQKIVIGRDYRPVSLTHSRTSSARISSSERRA